MSLTPRMLPVAERGLRRGRPQAELRTTGGRIMWGLNTPTVRASVATCFSQAWRGWACRCLERGRCPRGDTLPDASVAQPPASSEPKASPADQPEAPPEGPESPGGVATDPQEEIRHHTEVMRSQAPRYPISDIVINYQGKSIGLPARDDVKRAATVELGRTPAGYVGPEMGQRVTMTVAEWLSLPD